MDQITGKIPKKKVSFTSLAAEADMETPNPRNSPSSVKNPRRRSSRSTSPLKNDITSTPKSGLRTPTKTHTPAQKRQAAAKKALESIQSVGSSWGHDSPRIIAQNLEHVILASASTKDEEIAAKEQIKAIKAWTTPTDESGEPDPDDPSRSGLSTTPRTPKRKRRRDEVEDPDNYGINPLSDEQLRNQPDETHENQRPIKRLKRSYQKDFEPPVDFAKLNPQPIQIEYPVHPIDDTLRSDKWFSNQFRLLYRSAEKFSSQYFAIHDLDRGEMFEPWAVGHSKEFLAYAQQVAEPDLAMGGWDQLLRDTTERKWLVMGLIMEILRVKVFQADLIGATQQERELLYAQERAFFATAEGFGRTEVRASIVRRIMGRSPITQNFYTEVAHITASIALLLQPLIRYLYLLPPPPGKRLPLIADLYQSIHNLVSTACYLSLCIRWSPSIIFITPMQPGEPYDGDDHHNLEPEGYTMSKQIAVDTWTDDWNQLVSEITPANDEYKRLDDENKLDTREGRKISAVCDALYARQPPPLIRSHAALTKISVWPKITRFRAGSDEDDKAPNKDLTDKDGMRISLISKAATVCYYGRNGREGRKELQGHKLKRFVKQKRRKLGLESEQKGFGIAGGFAFVAATTAVAAWTGMVDMSGFMDFGSGLGSDVLENVVQFVGNIAEKLK